MAILRLIRESGGSLSRQVLRGSLWTGFSSTGERLLGLVRTMVLARLLIPEDFGLLASALVLMGGLHSFTITGTRSAIIQWKDLNDRTLSCAWTIEILRGFLLFGVLYLCAPFAGSFFGDERVVPVLRVLSLGQLIAGFQSVGLYLLDRELDFKTRTRFDLIAGLISTASVIVAAFILKSVWALVLGELVGSVVRVALSFGMHPHRPRLSFDVAEVKRLFDFGKHIMLSRIMTYVFTQGDDLLVGRFLGLPTLGIYTLAYQLSNLPATAISSTISNVTFPAYAKLQDRPDELRHAYLKTFRIVALTSIAAAALLLTFAPELVLIVYGADEQWAPLVLPIRILCVFGILRAINTILSSLLQGMGEQARIKHLALAQLIVFCVVTYPFLKMWSLPGVCVAVSLAGLTQTILAFRSLKHLLAITPGQYLPDFLRILSAAALASVAGISPSDLLAPGWIASGAGVVLFGIVFVGVMYLVGRRIFTETVDVVRAVVT